MSTPEEVIAQYLDRIPNHEFVEDAVREHGVPELTRTVVREVGSLHPPRVSDATAFMRDVALGLHSPAITAAFREELPRSGVFAALERALSAPAYSVRHDAVYTFGKLSFAENIPALLRAYETRREIDPFLIGSLLFEVRWLEHDRDAHGQRVLKAAKSSAELTRWAALSVAGEKGDSAAEELRALELVTAMEKDPSSFIRAEAAYTRETIDRRRRRAALSKAERKATKAVDREDKQRIERLRPPLIFETLMMEFPKTKAEPTVEALLEYLAPHRA